MKPKSIIAAVLCAVLLCGCGGGAVPDGTTVPTTPPDGADGTTLPDIPAGYDADDLAQSVG